MKARGLTHKQKAIGTLVVGAIVMIVTGFLMYPEGTKGVENPKYFYCRSCDKESNATPGQITKRCPQCGGELIGLAESAKKGGSKPKNPYVPMLIACAWEAIVFLGLFFYFNKPRQAADDEEDYFVTRCEKCSRKIKFYERQAGTLGQCPLCKNVIKFPFPNSSHQVSA